MLLTYEELSRWTGMTLFEIWINFIGLFVFTILLVLKLENVCDASWPLIFSPLFTAVGLNAYLTLIFFIRNLKQRMNKIVPIVKFCRSACLVGSLFMFYLLVSYKVTGLSTMTFPVVLVPLYMILIILVIRICHGSY